MKTRLFAEWKIRIQDKEGKMLKEICKDGDLISLNWIKMASAMGLPVYNTSSFTLVNEQGSVEGWNARSLHFWLYDSGSLPVIAVGSNNAPPNQADFRLGSEWARSGKLTPTFSNPSPNEWQMQISNIFSVTQEKILAELGVFWMLGGIREGYLACRDVLPQPITIPAGGSVTITYTLKSRSGG
jgi:hypothetical protein